MVARATVAANLSPPSSRPPDSSGAGSTTGVARFATPTPSPRHLHRHNHSHYCPSIPAAISPSSRTLSPSSSSDDTAQTARRGSPRCCRRELVATTVTNARPPGAGSAAGAARFTSPTPSPRRRRLLHRQIRLGGTDLAGSNAPEQVLLPCPSARTKPRRRPPSLLVLAGLRPSRSSSE
uniref:Uncharacterized protein n=1 Tax=Oryza nivara TaxID=4536 RepID=A0A0E0GMT9_ORYNI